MRSTFVFIPVVAVALVFAALGFKGQLSARAAAQSAGSAQYHLVQADTGKIVGSASCAVRTLSNGYQFYSKGQMQMAKFSYSFTNNNRLDSQLNIVNDQLTGTVNGQSVTFSLVSDTTGRTFNVSIVAQGKTTTNSFYRHRQTVLLPDLDPAAYVAMAHFALEHPATAWMVVPKQNGLLVPAKYVPDPDASGFLKGQPIALHHASVLVSSENGFSVEIYYTSQGELLEADLPEQNFYVIRDGFVLKDRPHYTPPKGSAPPPPKQQQQGSPQQP